MSAQHATDGQAASQDRTTSVDRDAATASLPTDSATPERATPGLVMIYDDRLRHRVIRVGSALMLGRGEQADVKLDAPTVSRRHAVVTTTATALSVEDLGSGQGTTVNAQRIDGATYLQPGDVLGLGHALFVVVDDADAQTPISQSWGQATWVGTSVASRAAEFVRRFGPANLSVLILGGTGTGKEVLAAGLHAHSKRKGPLVAVNCAALPKELAESQLFGHRRGAFSGATEDRRGFFALAHGGTLFLDEVGDLSAEVQAKLLRVLETSEVNPLGADRTLPVDVRVVSATCQDLQKQVEAGDFREDLYHRLHGVSFWMPPLRERTEEVGILTSHFLNTIDGGPLAVRSAAMEALLMYRWPGNVRQLRQVLHAALIRAQCRGADAIDVDDLQLPMSKTPSTPVQAETSRPPELSALVDAMLRHKGNVTKVAGELGAHRAQIYRVLEEHGLRSEQFR